MADESYLERLKNRLDRALRDKAVLAERSKLLAEQVKDSKRREDDTHHIVSELLDRQRELNFMLHRANSVLQRMQQANAALSSEFTDLVKELPDPQAPDWEQRVAKINELFQKTGELADEAQDAVFRKGIDSGEPTPPAPKPTPPPEPAEPTPTPHPAEPMASEQLQEAEEAEEFPQHDSVEPEAAVIEADLQPGEPQDEHEEPVVESAPHEEVHTIQDADFEELPKSEKIDRLFRGADASEDDTLGSRSAPGDSSPGLFSRIWRRLAVRIGKNGQDIVQAEDDSEPEPETDPLTEAITETVPDVEPVSDADTEAQADHEMETDSPEPDTIDAVAGPEDTTPACEETTPEEEPIPEVEPASGDDDDEDISPLQEPMEVADQAVETSDEPHQPAEEDEPARAEAGDDLWNEAAEEFDSIPVDIIPESPEDSSCGSVVDEEPAQAQVEQRNSVWERVKTSVSDMIEKQGETAVARARSRRRKRLNRRINHPRHTEAPSPS